MRVALDRRNPADRAAPLGLEPYPSRYSLSLTLHSHLTQSRRQGRRPRPPARPPATTARPPARTASAASRARTPPTPPAVSFPGCPAGAPDPPGSRSPGRRPRPPSRRCPNPRGGRGCGGGSKGKLVRFCLPSGLRFTGS